MFRRLAGLFAGIFFIITAAGLGAPSAAMPEVPIKIQIPILLKILSYDRNIKRHGSADLNIAVVFNADSKDSLKVKDELKSTIDPTKKLRGLGLAVEYIPFESVEKFTQIVETRNLAVVFLAPDLDGELDKILGVAKWKKVSTLSMLPKYVESGAVAGIELAGKHPRIVINLNSAKEQGCDFPAQLLKVARVIR